MPRTLLHVKNASNSRRGLIPGGSEQFNRYRFLRRSQAGIRSRNNDSSNSDHSLEEDPDMEMQIATNKIRTVSNELYLSLREKHTANLVYSPLGFSISTVMLKMGCNGASNEEIARALFQEEYAKGDVDEEEKSSEMITGLSALLRDINEQPQKAFTLKQAHKLFIETDHTLKSAYSNQVKVLYPGVEIEKMDFSNWEQASSKINGWAHLAGGKKLGEILTRRTEKNKIVLVNPIYFMGNWVHPFNPALTHDMKFFKNDKESISVPMMKSGILKNLLYAPIFNKLTCRAILLPYKGDRLGLVIFLPNGKSGLAAIESGLETLSPELYLKEMQKFRMKLPKQTGFQVYLPRFRIDSTLDLQIPLTEMGIETIFNPCKADFSRLSEKQLSLTQILQKVIIDVNELGEAKPPKHVEEGSMVPTSNEDSSALFSDGESKPETIEFRVDRPFYFQVIDMKTDLIILSGCCKDPLQGKEPGFKEFLEKYQIEVTPTTSLACKGKVKTEKAQTRGNNSQMYK